MIFYVLGPVLDALDSAMTKQALVQQPRTLLPGPTCSLSPIFSSGQITTYPTSLNTITHAQETLPDATSRWVWVSALGSPILALVILVITAC